MSAALANEPMAKLGCESVEGPDFDESLVAAFERVAVTFPSTDRARFGCLGADLSGIE